MTNKQPGRITRWLESTTAANFSLYAVFAAFWAYFCMYAFRKPFAAASYHNYQYEISLSWLLDGSVEPLTITLKTAIIIGQIVGYTLSKFIGIKICSEITRRGRPVALIGFILFAQFCWLLFAVLPDEWKFAAAFLNGLPLGMIWGLVVSYLEGRKSSEILLAGLSCSFIIASGMVKSVGAWIIGNSWIKNFATQQLSVATADYDYLIEAWMPALTGFLFLPGYLLAVWLLNQIPNPSAEDEQLRVHRKPMNRSERWAFVKQFALGLILIFIVYFFLTAYRDYRDNFQADILMEMGYIGDNNKSVTPYIMTLTELPVMFGVLVALAALNFIKDNRRGLMGAYFIMLLGTIILIGSTLMYDAAMIEGGWWMAASGLGLYLTYVPFGSVFFDRLIASTKAVGTAVFAIYVADALGYTGSVAMMLYKDFGKPEISHLEFFRNFSYFMALFGAVLLLISYFYFDRKQRPNE